MIFDTPRLPLPLVLDADLCVIGSGPGGAMVAMLAAEAGMRVVVLEAGEFMPPSRMTQREEQMFPRLFWDGGGRTTSDRAVKIHQGKGVGGSALHNLNLCKRIPRPILERWQRDRGLATLSPAVWDALYTDVERLLAVTPIPETMWNTHNRLLEKGCRELGWEGGGLSHNRTDCRGSGFCELGCAYDAKNNAAKVLIPRGVQAGAQVLASCEAVRIRHERGQVQGVDAVAVEPITRRPLGEVRVRAGQVCVSASATATPVLLQRSGVPDPGGETGRGLRIHPALAVAGEFADPVLAWAGTPQSYECTEWLRPEQEDGPRSWIFPAFAHPMGAAMMMPGHGQTHQAIMERYAHLAVFSAMLHDRTAGSVSPDGDRGMRIDYWPDAGDSAELMRGLWACVHLLMAAGARRVIVPMNPPRIIERGQPYDDLQALPLHRGRLDVTAVHPMATVPMGDDPQVAAVSSEGRHHHLAGLWVADGSLFPTSIGGPPQLSIYALGLHVGRALVQHAGRR
jgi:choline dehydrogenase-like flavoprotein